jgi:hypothetical protein
VTFTALSDVDFTKTKLTFKDHATDTVLTGDPSAGQEVRLLIELFDTYNNPIKVNTDVNVSSSPCYVVNKICQNPPGMPDPYPAIKFKDYSNLSYIDSITVPSGKVETIFTATVAYSYEINVSSTANTPLASNP